MVVTAIPDDQLGCRRVGMRLDHRQVVESSASEGLLQQKKKPWIGRGRQSSNEVDCQASIKCLKESATRIDSGGYEKVTFSRNYMSNALPLPGLQIRHDCKPGPLNPAWKPTKRFAGAGTWLRNEWPPEIGYWLDRC